jgi:hypothetical protein
VNDVTPWQQRNQDYLAAALAWLRLRLKRLNESTTADAAPSPKGWLLGRKQPALLPSGADGRAGDAELAQAAAALTETEDVQPPPAMLILGQRFGLSRFEREVLLLCVAMELDTRIAILCARAQDDASRPYPTFALAMALFDEPAWDAISPERPLRYWRLIEINQPAAQPLTTSPLRADERIVNYVKGLNYVDDRLTPLLVPFEVRSDQAELPPSQQAAVSMAVRHLQRAGTIGRPPVIQLVGPDPLSKQLVAQEAANALNLHLDRLPVELLPAQAAELELLVRLWQRESILLPISLYLDAHEADGSTQTEAGTVHTAPPLHRFLARGHGISFVGTREIRPGLGADAVFIEVDKPTPAEQRATWADALDGAAPESSSLLAGQFNLNLPTIRRIAQVAKAEPSGNGHTLHDRLWDICLMSTRPRLDLLAQRLDPKATWEDIVLPVEVKGLLRRIAHQVRQRSRVYDEWGFRQKMNRGLGISALFAGESGTGKTMAAEVIANELQLNLYRIDLSAVVSKYIGETEKNLRRLFDAAEDGGTILFFDEADALFGKRSEVKDSHDRYANIEINYLLQRMEAYRGLAILATNMKSALDQAFMRRLRFIVNFGFPGREERRAIWEGIFPPETPVDGLDLDCLARLNLTGGGIHNIALNAAFLAAQDDAPVTMPLLLDAARAEYRKMGRPIREADFRWEEPVVGSSQ